MALLNRTGLWQRFDWQQQKTVSFPQLFTIFFRWTESFVSEILFSFLFPHWDWVQADDLHGSGKAQACSFSVFDFKARYLSSHPLWDNSIAGHQCVCQRRFSWKFNTLFCWCHPTKKKQTCVPAQLHSLHPASWSEKSTSVEILSLLICLCDALTMVDVGQNADVPNAFRIPLQLR